MTDLASGTFGARTALTPAGAAAITPAEWVKSSWKRDLDSGLLVQPSDTGVMPREVLAIPDAVGVTATAARSHSRGAHAAACGWQGSGRYHAVRDTYARYCPVGQSFGWMRNGDHIDATSYSSGYIYGYIYGCLNAGAWVQADALCQGN